MIRTWLADIRALYDEECYQKYFAALPAFRQEKARKLLFQKDRAQSAGAWLLLEEIRKRYKISLFSDVSVLQSVVLLSRIPGIMCCARSTLMQERAYSLDVILRKSKRPEWS